MAVEGAFSPEFNWAFAYEIGAYGPEIRCEPDFNTITGVHWVYGGGLPGSKVLYILRIHADGTRQTVLGSKNLAMYNNRTYDKVRDFETDEETPSEPNSYTGLMSDFPLYSDLAETVYGTYGGVFDYEESKSLSEAYNTYDKLMALYPQYRDLLVGHSGKFAVLDTEVPLDQTFHYEVYIETGSSTPTMYASPDCYYPSELVDDAADPCSPLLLSDPLAAGMGQWVGLMKIDALTYSARQDLVDVISLATPVSVSDIRSAPRTTIYCMTHTLADRKKFLGLVGPGRILLLRNPDPNYPENNWYIALGDISEERIIPDHRHPYRKWTIPIAVVERPSGYLDAAHARSYTTLRDNAPDGSALPDPSAHTYKLLRNSGYGDYLSVLIGTREGFIPGSPSPTRAGNRVSVQGDLTYGTVTAWDVV